MSSGRKARNLFSAPGSLLKKHFNVFFQIKARQTPPAETLLVFRTRYIYLVKYSESLADLLLAVCVLHFSGHHGQELWEVDGSITWNG